MVTNRLLVALLAAAFACAAIPFPASAVPPPLRRLGPEALAKLASFAGKSPQRAGARHGSFRPLGSSEVRKLNALVLLVDFPDKPAVRAGSELRALYFSESALAEGSLHDFFVENSRGGLSVEGAVVGWLRAPKPYAYYVDGSAGLGDYPRNAQRLVEDAVAAARGRVDFSRFDCDGPDGAPASGDDDGLVDALIVVHSGTGAETEPDETFLDHILSHSFITSRTVDGGGADVLFYSMTPELGELGVHCHEFGHALGLIDLYDTTPPGNPDSEGLGSWSLMAYGSWGGPESRPGSRPVHLDAWSKAKLGFLTPVLLDTNAASVSIGPVETDGSVYRLWTNGDDGAEYFLVEHRAAAPWSFDEHLPASGLLVYRVDEAAGDNDRPARYRVALEQADGRRDLETGANLGDAGDPFPGSAGATAFGDETNPSSRARSGASTQISVRGIRAGGDGTIADLAVEERPAFRAAFIRSESDDGFPWPDWGAETPLVLRVANAGTAAGTTTATLAVDHPAVRVLNPAATLGLMDAGAAVDVPFTVETAAGGDVTSAVPATLVLSHDSGADTVAVEIPIGRSFGLATSFESVEESAGWSHAAVSSGWRDSWRLSSRRSATGTFAFGFADSARNAYFIESDGALTSPAVLLGSLSRLTFSSWIDAETEVSPYAYDGGCVEISRAGGPWRELRPEGGYPWIIDPFSETPLAGRGVFSGAPGGWEEASFDLRDFAGPVRFRFRFAADRAVNRPGWYVDDISVTTLAQPFRVVADEPVEETGGMRIRWRVEEVLGPYDGSGFVLYRRSDPPQGGRASSFVFVADIGADSAGAFSYVDAPLERGMRHSYLLEEKDEGGAVRAEYDAGSLFLAPRSGPPRLLDPYPVPFSPGSGELTLRFVLPEDVDAAGGRARLEVFDVRGRRVRALGDVEARAGVTTMSWDGRDEGARRVAAGVYFALLTAPGGSARRSVVVLDGGAPASGSLPSPDAAARAAD
jgi:immune inhibitor A